MIYGQGQESTQVVQKVLKYVLGRLLDFSKITGLDWKGLQGTNAIDNLHSSSVVKKNVLLQGLLGRQC